MQTTNQKGIVKLTKAQYNTLVTTGSVTDGSGQTFTYQDGYLYVTDEVEYVSFTEAQVLTPEQQAQARANIGAGSGSGGTEVYVNSVLQSTLSFDSDPQTQISAKVPKTTTIAGVDLQDNITKNELLTALNVEDGAEVNDVNDIEIDDVSCVTGTTAEIRTINGDYNASTNRLATKSDLSSLAFGFPIETTPSSTTLTDAQIASIIEGCVFKSQLGVYERTTFFQGLYNQNGNYYTGSFIGKDAGTSAYFGYYNINNSSKVITLTPLIQLADGKVYNISNLRALNGKLIENYENVIKSISVDGTALTPDANKNIEIPKATDSAYGVVKIAQGRGLDFLSDGRLYVDVAGDTQITNRTIGRPIATAQLNFAVKSALTDANHLTMTSSEQTVAQEVLGIPSAISNPNLLINGDFQVNQRQANSYSTSGKYTVDRWILRGSGSIAKQTTGIRLTSLSTDISGVFQSIEDYSELLGKTVTLSIKLSNVSVDANTKMQIGFGDSTSANAIGIDLGLEQFNPTAEIFSKTITLPASLTNSRLNVYAVFVSDNTISGDYVDIDYIKLEVGNVATKLSPKTYAEELSMCQRYYLRLNNDGNYAIWANGFVYSATKVFLNVSIPTSMRTRPTSTKNGNIVMLYNGGTKTFTDISVDRLAQNTISISITSSGMTVGQCVGLYVNNDNTAYIDFDAEIY